MPLRPERIWIDGCFDFFHHGHANALLQARELGQELYIGIHSDAEILKNKGPTVMNLEEREVAVMGNKWCTHCVIDAPYVTDPKVMDEYECQYVVHGDDITTDSDGNDCYGTVRDMGRLLLVKRTEGVSTTELINRLLLNYNDKSDGGDRDYYIKDIRSVLNDEFNGGLIKRFATGNDGKSVYNDVWYVSDDNEMKEIQTVKDDRDYDVYVQGAFDLFNPFHIEALKELKEKHNNVLVGVYKDGVENKTSMDLLQRSLCVLQCKYVDGLILGVDRSFIPIGIEKKSNIVNILDLTNKFDYLKNQGIQKRISEHYDLYVERQKKKGVKSELEKAMEKNY